MSYRVSHTIRFGLATAFAAVLAACTTTVQPPYGARNDSTYVRSLLYADLRAQMSRSAFAVSWDSTRVNLTTEQSRVVPGLQYHRATYSIPELSHGFAYAIAGSLGDLHRVFRSPADWASIVSTWRPGGEREAVQGCSELIQTVGADPDPRRRPRVVHDSIALREGMGHRPHMDGSPKITGQDRGVSVLLWVAESGIMRRYSCTLSWVAGPLAASIVVVDSLPGRGLPPSGP